MTTSTTTPPEATAERIAYTVKEAQERVPLPTSTIYKAISSGEIQSVRIGRKILIPAKPFHSKFGGSPT
jgi:excisionase family DNA binding protein